MAAMLRELMAWAAALVAGRGGEAGKDRFDRADRAAAPGALLPAVLLRLRDAALRTGSQARVPDRDARARPQLTQAPLAYPLAGTPGAGSACRAAHHCPHVQTPLERLRRRSRPSRAQSVPWRGVRAACWAAVRARAALWTPTWSCWRPLLQLLCRWWRWRSRWSPACARRAARPAGRCCAMRRSRWAPTAARAGPTRRARRRARVCARCCWARRSCLRSPPRSRATSRRRARPHGAARPCCRVLDARRCRPPARSCEALGLIAACSGSLRVLFRSAERLQASVAKSHACTWGCCSLARRLHWGPRGLSPPGAAQAWEVHERARQARAAAGGRIEVAANNPLLEPALAGQLLDTQGALLRR